MTNDGELTDLLDKGKIPELNDENIKKYVYLLKDYIHLREEYSTLYADLLEKLESYTNPKIKIHSDDYNNMPESILGMTDKLGNIWMNYKSIIKNVYNGIKVLYHEIRHNTIGPGYAMHEPKGEEYPVRSQSSTD